MVQISTSVHQATEAAVPSLSAAIFPAASRAPVWTDSQEMATTAPVNQLLHSRQKDVTFYEP